MKDMYILISMMKISAHPMSATDLFLFPFLNIFLLRLPILTRLVCSICCQKNVKKKYESETGEVKSRALWSQSWVVGAQLPNFLLCLEGNKKERTDLALMQPPSGGRVSAAGAGDPVNDHCCSASPERRGRNVMLFLCCTRFSSQAWTNMCKHVWHTGFQELFLLSGRYTVHHLQIQRTDPCPCTLVHLQIHCEDMFPYCLRFPFLCDFSLQFRKTPG